MDIQFSSGDESAPKSPTGRPHATIIVVGNFSGQHAHTAPVTSQATLATMVSLDPYNVDASIYQLAPIITINDNDQAFDIRISELDDFHPESLYRNLDIFAVTRALQKALSDPQKASQAMTIASELTGIQVTDAIDNPSAGTDNVPEPDIFLQLLGRSQGGSTPVSQTVDRLLADAVGKDAVTETPASVASMQAALDNLDQDAMRALLRSNGFRGVEAAWRSIEWLGQHIESDENIQIWLLDANPADPANWQSEVHAHSRKALAGEPVSMVAVLNDFSGTDESARQLRALSELSVTLDCPVLSGADAHLAGIEGNLDTHIAVDASDISCDQTDSVTRLRSDTTALGLGFPRLLLRQPYGERSDPVDNFEFEELEPKPAHETFFWVSSAIGLTLAWLAQHLGYAEGLVISDLPMVTYDDGGGQAIKPSAEIYLSDSAADALLSNGIMPLVCKRGDTSVSLIRLQSISDPPAAL